MNGGEISNLNSAIIDVGGYKAASMFYIFTRTGGLSDPTCWNMVSPLGGDAFADMKYQISNFVGVNGNKSLEPFQGYENGIVGKFCRMEIDIPGDYVGTVTAVVFLQP
jgi:hypothetical protein